MCKLQPVLHQRSTVIWRVQPILYQRSRALLPPLPWEVYDHTHKKKFRKYRDGFSRKLYARLDFARAGLVTRHARDHVRAAGRNSC